MTGRGSSAGAQPGDAFRRVPGGARLAAAFAIWLVFVGLRQTLAGYIALPPAALPYPPGTIIPDVLTGSFMWVLTRHLWIAVDGPPWLFVAAEGALLATALVGAYPAGAARAGRAGLAAVGVLTALTAVGCCGVVLPDHTLALLYDNLSPLAPFANAVLVASAAGFLAYGLLGGRLRGRGSPA